MRELRFRAWDIENEEMHYSETEDDQIIWVFRNGEPKFVSYESVHTINDGNDFEHEEYIERPQVLMQYTGLKDAIGVEIYEGDIVRWDDMSKGKYWRVAIVGMSPGFGGLGFKCFDCPSIKNSSAHGHVFKYGNFAYQDTENHLTIIGNIHQNPELLEPAP